MVLFCQLLKACTLWEDSGDMTTDEKVQQTDTEASLIYIAVLGCQV